MDKSSLHSSPNPGQTTRPSKSTALFYISSLRGGTKSGPASGQQSLSVCSRRLRTHLFRLTSTQNNVSTVCSYRCTSITALTHWRSPWQTAVMILRWRSDSCFYILFAPSAVMSCFSLVTNVLTVSCFGCWSLNVIVYYRYHENDRDHFIALTCLNVKLTRAQSSWSWSWSWSWNLDAVKFIKCLVSKGLKHKEKLNVKDDSASVSCEYCTDLMWFCRPDSVDLMWFCRPDSVDLMWFWPSTLCTAEGC